MSMRPHRLCASSTIALMSRSLVTSASNAIALPPSASIIPAVSCAENTLRSTHSTRAPSRAKVSAVARPLPMPSPGLCPAPTTMAVRSFKRMSVHSRDRVLLQYLFVVGLVVDLHGGEHADHGAVEGDGEHQIGHVLVRKILLDLGEGGLGHADVAHHLARALEDRLGERLELAWLTLGLGEQALDVLVGDAELLADLDVMGELVLRALHPADLQDRQLGQARMEL